ncbi:MAG: AMP-activated serine/threonine-protein kinase regulatory subunit [Watsoniomyces obsoletus]|nr:MAG: AMP-activated serine/threonine-protein kinase regulatory subunit [Watsoniomyces obsoletus]
MGLASKLAGAQGGYPPPGAPPGGPPGAYGAGYPPQGQPGGGQYPGQGQYQAYPGGYKPGAPQGQQAPYGAPQGGYPPQGGQYGAPQPSGPPDPQRRATYLRILQKVVQEKNLSRLYPLDGRQLSDIAGTISGQVDQLSAAWRVPQEVAVDFIKLALFDVVLYIGRWSSGADSGRTKTLMVR